MHSHEREKEGGGNIILAAGEKRGGKKSELPEFAEAQWLPVYSGAMGSIDALERYWPHELPCHVPGMPFFALLFFANWHPRQKRVLAIKLCHPGRRNE